jgi:citrate lyase subunit beta/citryl-CoA lyase
VRINSLDAADGLADARAIAASGPDGIVLPKVRSVDDVLRLAHVLDHVEAQENAGRASIRILPVATEVPEAVFYLGGYAAAGARLYGLTWGAEELSLAVGASANKQPDGSWTQPYQLVRSLCLFGASAAGVPAFDTLHADFRDERGLRAACDEARRDGFAGKLAIHPDQVAVINECFSPTEAEVAHARRIVQLFKEHPGVATIAMDGKMLDIPHLRQAERLLARAVPR